MILYLGKPLIWGLVKFWFGQQQLFSCPAPMQATQGQLHSTFSLCRQNLPTAVSLRLCRKRWANCSRQGGAAKHNLHGAKQKGSRQASTLQPWQGMGSAVRSCGHSVSHQTNWEWMKSISEEVCNQGLLSEYKNT